MKAEFGKCSWYPKRKFGVTMHFSEIISFNLEKKITIHCFVLYCFFEFIVAKLSLKNAWLPPICFLDSNGPCLNLLFAHSDKPRKNTSVSVGTVL